MANETPRPYPQRKALRLRHYDYASAGAYFVTVCTAKRQNLFGQIVDGQMILSQNGLVVQRCWAAIDDHFEQVELDYSVVMPNHVHGVLLISGLAGSGNPADRDGLAEKRFGRPTARSLRTIIGSFKSAVSKELGRLRGRKFCPWQERFYDHVVRDEDELGRIRKYIDENPLRWQFDRENPEAREITGCQPWDEPVPETTKDNGTTTTTD